MNDRKNFSALGQIDEKYIEEAAAYSPEQTTGAGLKRPRKGRGMSALKKRVAAVAAGGLVLCLGGFSLALASGAFEGKKSFSGDANLGVDDAVESVASGAGESIEDKPPSTENDSAGGDNDAAGDASKDSSDSESDSSSDESGEKGDAE